MTLDIRPFEPRHLTAFAETAAETWLRPYLQDIDLDALAVGPGWTGFYRGKPVGAAGFIEWDQSDVRAGAWAIFMPAPRPAIVAAHRAMAKMIAQSPYRRIEANVAYGFSASHKWMELLGFEVETERKRCWFPDGKSATEYVLIRGTA